MCRECREGFPRHRLQRKPLVSYPGMHRGTCVTHVPWYMSGSLTHGGGENVPDIPGACATRNFTYLVRGPLTYNFTVMQSYIQKFVFWISTYNKPISQFPHVSDKYPSTVFLTEIRTCVYIYVTKWCILGYAIVEFAQQVYSKICRSLDQMHLSMRRFCSQWTGCLFARSDNYAGNMWCGCVFALSSKPMVDPTL